MNIIGVKFLMDHGHFLIIPATEPEYQKLKEEYINAMGSQRHRPLSGMAAVAGELVEWLVWTHRIVAIHTFDYRKAEQNQAAPPWQHQGGQGWMGSGLN